MDPDLILILKMKQGNEGAWDVFVRKHYPDILKYCFFHCPSRDRAEDLTQEVFLRFVSSLPRYRHRGKAKNYLYTIAANLCRTTPAGHRELPLDQLPEEGTDPIPALEDRLLLERAVARLPEEFREVVLLRYYQGLTLGETAAILNIGLPLAKYRLRRAKELLRKETADGFE